MEREKKKDKKNIWQQVICEQNEDIKKESVKSCWLSLQNAHYFLHCKTEIERENAMYVKSNIDSK